MANELDKTIEELEAEVLSELEEANGADAPMKSAGKADPMEKPKGKLALQVVAMPADTNPAGDIFGGWLLSQMDIAGGIFCR